VTVKKLEVILKRFFNSTAISSRNFFVIVVIAPLLRAEDWPRFIGRAPLRHQPVLRSDRLERLRTSRPNVDWSLTFAMDFDDGPARNNTTAPGILKQRKH